nr:hypothetical protein CFP56_79321 [Quercus suber]
MRDSQGTISATRLRFICQQILPRVRWWMQEVCSMMVKLFDVVQVGEVTSSMFQLADITAADCDTRQNRIQSRDLKKSANGPETMHSSSGYRAGNGKWFAVCAQRAYGGSNWAGWGIMMHTSKHGSDCASERSVSSRSWTFQKRSLWPEARCKPPQFGERPHSVVV